VCTFLHRQREKLRQRVLNTRKEEKNLKLRLEKGTYGYRTAYKKRQLFFVVLFLAAIGAQLILRNFIAEQIYKNLITISAILTVLPMANLASPLVVASRIPEVPEELHKACLPYEDKFPILYDLIITSNDLIMPVDAAAIHPTGVYLYCTGKNVDKKKAEKFLNEMLVGWKLDGNAKVMTEEKKFLRRLSELKAVTEDEDDGSRPYVLKLLKSLSM